MSTHADYLRRQKGNTNCAHDGIPIGQIELFEQQKNKNSSQKNRCNHGKIQHGDYTVGNVINIAAHEAHKVRNQRLIVGKCNVLAVRIIDAAELMIGAVVQDVPRWCPIIFVTIQGITNITCVRTTQDCAELQPKQRTHAAY